MEIQMATLELIWERFATNAETGRRMDIGIPSQYEVGARPTHPDEGVSWIVRRIDAEGVWAEKDYSEDSVEMIMDYLQRLIREDHENRASTEDYIAMTPIDANSFSLTIDHGEVIVVEVSGGTDR